jgi:hypothetical protein
MGWCGVNHTISMFPKGGPVIDHPSTPTFDHPKFLIVRRRGSVTVSTKFRVLSRFATEDTESSSQIVGSVLE